MARLKRIVSNSLGVGMNNYKIINTHTNEIIKALNDLGYVWTPKKFDEQDCLLKAHWILAEQSGAITYASSTMIDSPLDFKELTLPQLRDLVVLQRNDVKDAKCIDKKGEAWYLTSEGKYYAWQYRAQRWDVESDSCIAAHEIKPIQKPQPEQGLISGADAKLAWANGEALQIRETGTTEWLTLTDTYTLMVFDYDRYEIRLNPRTIKLELEIPAPFEPKDGDICFVPDSDYEDGWTSFMFSTRDPEHKEKIQFGAWRTEGEIKQVVAALRGIKG